LQSRKIVLLTVSLAQGGAEAVVVQLAKALRSIGWRVSVVSMLTPEAFCGELKAAEINVVSLDMKAGRLNIRGLARFLAYLWRFRPDIVHAHMYHANVLARLIGALTSLKVVCTIHNEKESSRRKDTARARERIYRLTNWACSRTTVISEVVGRRYVRDGVIPADRLEVIPNGVDINRFRNAPVLRKRLRTALGWRHDFVWLTIGRFELAKDYPNLIRAFERARREKAEARLVIVGEGRLRQEVEAMIAVSGLQESIQLLGFRSDVPDLINACDAFVLASAWEGMPLVLLEAAACGRAVVATTVGAAPELVIPEGTGYLTPPRNAEALSRAMVEVMSLKAEERDRLGRLGRERVMRSYTVSAMTGSYARLYDQLLGVAAVCSNA
jgi:glycosyltransferase involved in cell wall biosynthesis